MPISGQFQAYECLVLAAANEGMPSDPGRGESRERKSNRIHEARFSSLVGAVNQETAVLRQPQLDIREPLEVAAVDRSDDYQSGMFSIVIMSRTRLAAIS